MSYDLTFLRKSAGETWDEAMSRLEVAAELDTAWTDQDIALWDAVLSRVRPLLPGAEEIASQETREITDATGIQLSLGDRNELGLSVPYWYSGEGAQAMVERLETIVSAIEEASGLTAYDPQADAPFIGDGQFSAAVVFDDIHRAGTPE